MSNAIANQLYLAYLGRPSDTAWRASTTAVIGSATGPSVALQNAFYTAAVLDGTFSLGDSSSQLVNKIFLNIFGFGANTFEQSAWGQLINNGTITAQTAAWTIFSSYLGAPNTASYVTAAQSKLVVLDAYTNALANDPAANLALTSIGGTAAISARTFLSTVTSQSTAATAVAGIATTVSTLGSSQTGSSFTLTSGIDNFVGTSGNDVFVADISNTASISSSADSLNGGAGTDTFRVFTVAANALTLPTLTSVENLYVNGLGQDLDISSVSSITSFEVDNFTGVADRTFTVNGQAVTLSNTAAPANKVLIAGNSSTSQSLTLSKFGTTTAQTVDLTGTALTAVTVRSTGGVNKITLTDTGAKVATVTLTGDTALTATIGAAATGFVSTGITSIDASAMTAAASLTVVGGGTAGQSNLAATFSYKGGTGNDSLDLNSAFIAGAALAVADINKMTFDGGAGTDTVTVSATVGQTTTAITTFSNIEKIGVAAATGTIAANNFGSAVTGIVLSGTLAGNVTVNNLASTGTFELGASNVNSKALTVNATGSGTADTLTLTTGSSTAGITNGAALSISGYETVNLTSQGTANAFTAVTIGASAGGSETVNLTLTKDFTATGVLTLSGSSTTLNVSGAGALTIGGVVTAGVVNVTSTGAIDLSAGANNILAFNASGNNAQIKVDVSGAASASFVTLGNGANTVVGSASNDVIRSGTGASTITGGAGADSITVGAHTGVVTINQTTTGASGAFTAPGANTISTSTFDVLTGVTKSDKIALNTVTATAYNAAANATLTAGAIIPDGVSATTLVGAGAQNTATFVRGTYTSGTNTFVGSASGSDTLLVVDQNAATGTAAYEGIVLVGYVAASVTGIGGANGVITLG